jgi:hypothetical protein
MKSILCKYTETFVATYPENYDKAIGKAKHRNLAPISTLSLTC